MKRGDDQTFFVRSGLQAQEALFMAHDVPAFGSIRVKDGLRMVDKEGELAVLTDDRERTVLEHRVWMVQMVLPGANQ